MSWFKRVPLLALVFVLAGCGFQPLYGGSASSGVRAQLSSVEVALIKDRVGQQLRNELLNRITPLGEARQPAYRLKVVLSVAKQSLAVKKSEIATRANLRFNASYSLVANSDGKVVTKGASRITTSYNILTNDFATIAAEADAQRRGVRELADDITNRVAAFFQIAGRG